MTEQQNVPVEASRVTAPAEQSYAPAVDVYETDEATVVLAEMPGVTKEDIRVEVDKGVLTVSGQTSWDAPGGDYNGAHLDFAPGQFYRAFALSDEIDRGKIAASVSDGVLKLTLGKAEASRTRRIEIQTD